LKARGIRADRIDPHKLAKKLTETLREQQAEAAKLDAAITANLREIEYGS